MEGTIRQYLFGNGRILGVPFGSIDDYLNDPFSTDEHILKKFWRDGRTKIDDEHIGLVARRLVSNINRGESNHIPGVIDELLAKYVMQANFDQQVQDTSTLFNLYDHLIVEAESKASIPFLLRALDSEVVIIGEKIKIVEEKLKGYRHLIEDRGDGVYYVTYAVYEQKNVHKVLRPFSELACRQLYTLSEGLNEKMHGFVFKALDRYHSLTKSEMTFGAEHLHEYCAMKVNADEWIINR